jgi:DNA modification methylase
VTGKRSVDHAKFFKYYFISKNLSHYHISQRALPFQSLLIKITPSKTTQKTYIGDARNLNKIETESIDLIATHPPYANIIPYSKERIEGDLSNVHSIPEFAKEMKDVARECFRVLKPNHFCAILIGDTRRNLHYVPVAYRTLNSFLEVGFILREDIIKHQWQCKSTPYWVKKSMESNFLMIMHEHLFVFRKPAENEKLKKYKESMA